MGTNLRRMGLAVSFFSFAWVGSSAGEASVQWVQVAGGPGNDSLVGLVADPNGGTVELTRFGGGEYGLVLTKRDGSGNAVWEQPLVRGVGTGYINPHALSISPQGNIFLAWQARIMKFDSNGQLLWQREVGNVTSEAAADAQDNVVVSYEVYVKGRYIAVAKYDSDGTLLWRSEETRGTLNLTVDPAGNVIVSGNTDGNPIFGRTYRDWFLARVDPNAQTIWGVDLPPGVFPKSLGTSAAGTVVVMGNFSDSFQWGGDILRSYCGSFSGFVLTAEADGSPGWARDLQSDRLGALAVDPMGGVAVIVNGVTTDPEHVAGYTRMHLYNMVGQELWWDYWPRVPISRTALIWTRAAAFTTGHDLVFGGTFEGTINFGLGDVTSTDSDAFVLDYSFDAP